MRTKTNPEKPFEGIEATDLDRLLEFSPWFTAARFWRQLQTGKGDSQLAWMSADRHWTASATPLDVEALLRLSSEDLIDRFLREKELRIVAEEGEPTEEIVIEAELDEEDDLVSEDLAEVYLNQGLKQEALEIYRRLCLLNPEKSIYFAEIIQRLETNN